jgi:muconolactone delta-isomerase
MAKFLVLWRLQPAMLNQNVMSAVLKVSEYAKKLKDMGKLDQRYHLIGRHGGAWIYSVDSNEELDRLLAMSPVYNFADYEVLPLAEMEDQTTILEH